MKLISLSGWSRPADELFSLTDDTPGVVHQPLDYQSFPTLDATFRALEKKQPDIIFGWSLGGQVAMAACGRGVIQPKALILLSSAWQFVADNRMPSGMEERAFDAFCHNYELDSHRQLKRFAGLIAHGDSYEAEVREQCRLHVHHSAYLRYWLAVLGALSGAKERWQLPPVCVIHGEQDAIVAYAQASHITAAASDCEVHLWPRCAHAPHLHNEKAVQTIIREYIQQLI